ncbi:MAG TPA: hypothetical protein VNJ01_04960 [Bacteriovoracaceae bacterium]|nr:hypothetical protein [Bacteriovoracaceae bacterium]
MKLLICWLLLLSCANYKVTKVGGGKPYLYEVSRDYSLSELAALSTEMVTTSRRDPPVSTLDHLFSKKQPPVKRIGILIFESEVQPTRGGLAGENKIYPSESGKQILTENFLSVWEQSLPIAGPALEVSAGEDIRSARALKQYGSPVTDYIKTDRTTLAPGDIGFLEAGRRSASATVINPRELRDLSFVLVPAYRLMGGPKWSEQNKHYINDLVKELKLDAALVIMSEVSWSAAQTDKRSGEVFPEELKLALSASVLVPVSSYHSRLERLGIKDRPNVTLSYRAYQSEISVPAVISVPPQMQNFDTIQRELISPMMKTYKDLALMTIIRIDRDLRQTH